MPIEFRLLGAVQVWKDGSVVDLGSAGSAKTRCILAVLLRTPGRLVTTDALVERVWGDRPPSSATRYKYVGWLRSALAACDVPVLHRDDGYLLPVRTDQIDLFRFRALATQARDRLVAGAPTEAAVLAHCALGLWHAPPLMGLRGAWSELFRVQLDRERRGAAVLRFRADLAAGASAGLADELADWEAEYPLDEEIAALRVRALLLAGDLSEARRCHDGAMERIRVTLGGDPGAALRDLSGELAHRTGLQLPSARAQSDPPSLDVLDDGSEFASWRRLAQLPPDVTDFVGREEEQRRLLAAVDGMTRSGHQGPVSVLSGAPGIGKTALAVRVAYQVTDRFRDGQLFVSMHGTADHPPTASDVAARLVRALGAPEGTIPPGPEERVALWRSMTADRSILLVLDDAADERQIRPLLPTGRRCFTLVTARSRLSGLAGVHRIHLDVPPAEAGLLLLTRIVGADRVRREPLAAAELVASCGRLPLAVRVIGNRLDLWPHWSLSHLNERLGDERARLSLLRAGDLQVRTAIQVSYRALTRGGAHLFRLLALVPGPEFDVDLAAVLLGQDRNGTGELLDELAEASLVEGTSVSGRYRFHDLVRVYAAEALREQEPAPRRDAAESEALRWVMRRAAGASALIAPPTVARSSSEVLFCGDRSAAVRWLDSRWPTVLAALRAGARVGLHQEVSATVDDLSWYVDLRCAWADLLTLAVLVEQSADELDDDLNRVRAWYYQGLALYGLDRNGEALAVLQRSEAQARCIGATDFEASACDKIGLCHVAMGRPELALPYHRRDVTLSRRLSDCWGEAAALSHLAMALRMVGRPAEAAANYRAAGRLLDEIGDARGKSMALNSLGLLCSDEGRDDEALTYHQAALPVFAALDDRWGVAYAEYGIGRALAGKADHDAALSHLARAATTFESLGEHQWVSRVRQAVALLPVSGTGMASQQPPA